MARRNSLWVKKMAEAGLEPARGFPHGILNPERLPIPPLGRKFTID